MRALNKSVLVLLFTSLAAGYGYIALSGAHGVS